MQGAQGSKADIFHIDGMIWCADENALVRECNTHNLGSGVCHSCVKNTAIAGPCEDVLADTDLLNWLWAADCFHECASNEACVHDVIVLLEWLFRQEGRSGPAGGDGRAIVLVAGVCGEGVDAARRDIQPARAILASGQQPGDGLDAGADGVRGGERAAGQFGLGEGVVERADMLWLVGAAAPDAHVVFARQFEQGGDDDGVERGAALAVFVELPGALVLIDAEDGGGGGVGVAPVYPTDDAAERFVFRRIGDIATLGGVEGIHQPLEGGEEAKDFLVVKCAAEAEVGDVVGRQIRGVLLRGGAVERVVGAGR